MRTHVGRVTTLADNARLWVRSTVCVDHLGAVVLLVRLAVDTLSASSDLGTNTNSLSLLELGDLVTCPQYAADNLVSNAKRQRCLSPSSSDGVDIRAADTAGINGNINIVLLERLMRSDVSFHPKCYANRIGTKDIPLASPPPYGTLSTCRET
jgi:hypothetical protein